MKNCKMITVIPEYELHQCDLSNVDKKKFTCKTGNRQTL